MINKLEIENFRQFTKIKLEGFKRLNFIIGDNGSGKSSVLEAIYLANSLGEPRALLDINKIRHVSNIEYAFYCYNVHNLQINEPIILAKDNDDVYQRFAITIKKGKSFTYDTAFDRDNLVNVKSSTEYKVNYDIEMLNKKTNDSENASLNINTFFHNCVSDFASDDLKQFKDFEVLNHSSDHYTNYNDKTLYLSTDHHAKHIIEMFKKVMIMGQKDFFISLLKHVNPYIENIYICDSSLTKIDINNDILDGSIFIKYDNNKNPYPFDLLNENFKLYFYFIASILVNEYDVLLSDNVSSYLDSQIKVSSIETLFELMQNERYVNTQIFITTRDKEFAKLVCKILQKDAYKKLADDVCFTTIRETKNSHEIRRYGVDEINLYAIDNIKDYFD